MQYGDIRDDLHSILQYLKNIDRNTKDFCCDRIPGAGTGTSVPAGYKSIQITQTSASGTVVITMPDSSTYTLAGQNQSINLPFGGPLPAITVSSSNGATWSWVGLK